MEKFANVRHDRTGRSESFRHGRAGTRASGFGISGRRSWKAPPPARAPPDAKVKMFRGRSGDRRRHDRASALRVLYLPNPFTPKSRH